MIKKIIKSITIVFFLLLLSGCFSVSKIDNKSTPSQLKSITVKDLDKNKDNVIDSNELKAYQECSSPDSSTPLYVMLIICGFTGLMCILPKCGSYIKNKIKK